MKFQYLLDLTDSYIQVLEEENVLINKMQLKESRPIMEKKLIISKEYNSLLADLQQEVNFFKALSKNELILVEIKSKKLKKLIDDNNSLISFAIKLTEEMISLVIEQLGGKGLKSKGYNHRGILTQKYKSSPNPISLSEAL